uniref:Uncharacterized protein n=1 Tax=Mycobacterium leprae TaxID=1769 RepID=O07693_MYCLR|nr:hypothetical protein MLCL383.19 [Mycobacterium leprae]
MSQAFPPWSVQVEGAFQGMGDRVEQFGVVSWRAEEQPVAGDLVRLKSRIVGHGCPATSNVCVCNVCVHRGID